MKNSFVFLSVLWALAAPAQPQTIFDALRKGDFRTARALIEESPALPGASGAAGEGIWFADRMAAGWSVPRPLDPMVNGHAMHWEFSLDRQVNSPSIELAPIATADGKYLFFPSRRHGGSHAYWARADVIEKARAKPGPENPSDSEERRAIEQSIRDCIGWAQKKDLGLLYKVIANDPDFLEVHPDGKVVKGFDEFRQAERIWKSPDFKAVRYEIRDLRIKLSSSRDVAWFYCILDDINEWKGKPANWENTHWTGVLEKRDGLWIMVQQHFSK